MTCAPGRSSRWSGTVTGSSCCIQTSAREVDVLSSGLVQSCGDLSSVTQQYREGVTSVTLSAYRVVIHQAAMNRDGVRVESMAVGIEVEANGIGSRRQPPGEAKRRAVALTQKIDVVPLSGGT